MSKKLQNIYILVLKYGRELEAHRYICALSDKHVLQVIAKPMDSKFYGESYTVISKSLITFVLELANES